MSTLAVTRATLMKDLRMEWRSKDAINSMLFFALLVVVIFSFAFSPTAEESRHIAGGLIWVAFLFAAVVALNQTWARELRNQVLDAYRAEISTGHGLSKTTYSLLFLAGLFLAKLLATMATVGSGAVGGVFTPTLFVGASLGFLFGTVTHDVTGSASVNPSAFAIVGMGAFLAAATHAPIMAIIMIFELTLDHQIILPLMLACVVGYYTSVNIEKRSIYAEALKRKGAGDYAKQLAELHVRDLMKPNPLTISPTTGFSEIGEKFIDSRFNHLYVTDNGRFLGAISLHDIKSYLNTPDLARVVIAGDILHDSFPVVRASASLAQAMEGFSHHDGERLPVVSHDRELVGSISKTDVILALAGSTARPATTTSSPGSQ